MSKTTPQGDPGDEQTIEQKASELTFEGLAQEFRELHTAAMIRRGVALEREEDDRWYRIQIAAEIGYGLVTGSPSEEMAQAVEALAH